MVSVSDSSLRFIILLIVKLLRYSLQEYEINFLNLALISGNTNTILNNNKRYNYA